MKRVSALLAAALVVISLAGISCAEEAKPAEQKDAAAATTEAKPAKKMKKAAKNAKAETKKEAPAKKKKEAAGC